MIFSTGPAESREREDPRRPERRRGGRDQGGPNRGPDREPGPGAFRISPAYLLPGAEQPPLVDQELLRVPDDEKSRLLFFKSVGFSDAEYDMLLDIIDHLSGPEGLA